jgi:hypothetical protein
MNASWMRPRWRWAAVAAAAGTLAASAPAASLAAAGHAASPAAGGPGRGATIVRTTYGIPHITARGFGFLGYGYGYALVPRPAAGLSGSRPAWRARIAGQPRRVIRTANGPARRRMRLRPAAGASRGRRRGRCGRRR